MEPPDASSFPSISHASHSSSQRHPRKPRILQLYPSYFFPFCCFVICRLAAPAVSRIQAHDFLPIIPNPRIPYSNYCSHIVAEAPLETNSTISAATFRSLGFSAGYFTGGDGLFNIGAPAAPSEIRRSASLSIFSAHKAITDQNVFRIEARLTLRMRRSSSNPGDLARRKLRMVHFRGPRIPRGVRFGPGLVMTGFWSESTAKLCMVGSGWISSATGNPRSVDAVLKLNYSRNSSIYGSLVGGVLESAEDGAGLRYFEPVSILGVSGEKSNYVYTLLDEGRMGCGETSDENLALDGMKGGLCSVAAQLRQVFRLKYESECYKRSCSPLTGADGYIPEFMSLKPLKCDEESRMRFLLSFHNSSSIVSSFRFDPQSSLVAEGAWDAEKKRFCAVACKISNLMGSVRDAAVSDCSVKVSFSFPAVLSLKTRSAMVGQVWSNMWENEPGFFSKIECASLKEPLWSIPGLTYQYAATDRAICSNKKQARRRGNDYPNGHSSDMELFLKLKNSKGDNVAGFAHASPLFVGDQLYHNRYVLSQGASQPGVAQHINNHHKEFINISYGFRLPTDFRFEGDGRVFRDAQIFAEGTYDKSTGLLCMLGCLSVEQESVNHTKNISLDCDIIINVQFSPLKSRSINRLEGSIESTRDKSDPLYFGIIKLWSQSMSSSQAKESVWRMDLEVIMLLISSTLSCIFLGTQLHHVKRNRETLPFISIVMLITLILGSVVPLVLNLRALVRPDPKRRSMFFGNDSWLEANEIVVRIVTMVAFVLELRLLQLSWSLRQGREDRKSIWDSEKKAVYLLLPLYVAGGLIAWLVNRFRNTHTRFLQRPHARYLLYRPSFLRHRQHRPLWSDLKSYGGLVCDEFLLPQVLFNAFYDSREKSLAGAFYTGITLTRLLPHAYDLYRGYGYPRSLDWSYIYADHKMDYYSTAWNVFIPSTGLLFAVLVFLQQRSGGRVILPRKFRLAPVYQKLPVSSTVELQADNTPTSVYSS